MKTGVTVLQKLEGLAAVQNNLSIYSLFTDLLVNQYKKL